MNAVYCLLTYVLLSFLIYTSLDRTFVESSPIIPDGSRYDQNNEIASDADNAKKLLNSVGANEEVNIDNGNNDGNENQGHISEERREEENGETYEGQQDSEDVQDVNDGGLNEDIKEGDDQRRDYVRWDEHNEQKQTEADGYSQQSAREDGKDKILSEHSAQNDELLPVDPQEGQGVEKVRNPEMTKGDNSYQQSAVRGDQNSDNSAMANSVQSHETKSNLFGGTDVSETIRKLGLFVNPPVQGSAGADSRPTVSAYVPKDGVGGDQGQGQPDQSQQATYKPNQQPTGNSDSSTAFGNPSMSLVPANNNPDVAKETTTKFAIPVTSTPNPQNMQVSVAQSQGLPVANENSGGQNGQQSESGSRQPNIQDNQSSQQHQNSVPYSQESQNTDLSSDQSKQKGIDVPDEFQAGDAGVDADEDTQSENHYSEDGYLEPPSNNLDNDRVIGDKTEEDTNRNNNYDDSSDPNANLNNKNIIDDNNENVIYNGGNNQESVYDGEEKKDSDESYDDTNDDDDDFSYREKIDNIDSNESKTLDPSDKDDWYDDNGDDTGEDGNNEDKDFEHTDIDEEAEFRYTHVKHPESKEDESSLYFSNMDPKIQEGVVEYKLVNNHTSLNAPSSMVLFYTWIILIVLIAVVTFSAFRYRCKGLIMNGSRNYRNGNHGNFRNGEENKKLLENVYT